VGDLAGTDGTEFCHQPLRARFREKRGCGTLLNGRWLQCDRL